MHRSSGLEMNSLEMNSLEMNSLEMNSLEMTVGKQSAGRFVLHLNDLISHTRGFLVRFLGDESVELCLQ